MFDLIIIGAGPAGITAAVYSARQKLKTLVISKDIGGQAALSADIENYTGYQFITGAELAKKFEEHIKKYDIELKEGEEVIKINKQNNLFSVKTNKKIYRGKAVIIASGRKPRMLNVPGEAEFKNKGVTYCATCDSILFANKTVAVIGGGNAALDAAAQLTSIAKKVYIIVKGKTIAGEKIVLEKLKNYKKCKIIYNADTKKVLGGRFVNGLIYEQDGKEKKIDVQGIFIEIGSMPATDFIDFVQKNEYGEIKINSKCKTNVAGIFAAGDATDVPEKQIIVAAGEGAKAAITAFKYLQRIK